jgi:hypothetical protein
MEGGYVQHHITIKRHPSLQGSSLGLLNEPSEGWQRKARELRIRRERQLKQRFRLRRLALL